MVKTSHSDSGTYQNTMEVFEWQILMSVVIEEVGRRRRRRTVERERHKGGKRV